MPKSNIRVSLFLLLVPFSQKNNFVFCREKHLEKTFPVPYSFLVEKTFKDQYNFDFITLPKKHKERDLENKLVEHIQKFLLKLGKGFTFFGKQHRIKVGENNFYIDLLLYHTKLKCFIVVELKKGDFQPRDAGQLNFYLSVIDDQLKGDDDNPTMGLLICKTKNRLKVKYALRDINKPIGVAKYKTRVPKKLKNALPNAGEINAGIRKLRKLQKAKKRRTNKMSTKNS